jgi:hypothetical protein
MVGAEELERLILERVDPALQMLVLADDAIAKKCHDVALAVRLHGYLQSVRRELAGFAVRVEAGGGYRSEADVDVAMEREFPPAESALQATLAMLDHKLHLGGGRA